MNLSHLRSQCHDPDLTARFHALVRLTYPDQAEQAQHMHQQATDEIIYCARKPIPEYPADLWIEMTRLARTFAVHACREHFVYQDKKLTDFIRSSFPDVFNDMDEIFAHAFRKLEDWIAERKLIFVEGWRLKTFKRQSDGTTAQQTGTIEAWLLTVIKNKALDIIRKHKRECSLEGDDGSKTTDDWHGQLSPLAPASATQPDHTIQEVERLSLLRKRLPAWIQQAGLARPKGDSPINREIAVFQCRILQRLSTEQTSKHLRISKGAVGTALNTALNKLRPIILADLAACPDLAR